MKTIGIVFWVFSALNLIVAIIGCAIDAPASSISMKFNAFILLGTIGGLLYYFGNKKNK